MEGDENGERILRDVIIFYLDIVLRNYILHRRAAVHGKKI